MTEKFSFEYNVWLLDRCPAMFRFFILSYGFGELCPGPHNGISLPRYRYKQYDHSTVRSQVSVLLFLYKYLSLYINFNIWKNNVEVVNFQIANVKC